MKRNTIDIITLGCSKNLVDSEKLMRQLEANGYKVTHDSDKPQGEIAVINTCGFIGDAKEESIKMILEFAERKEEGELKKLFVISFNMMYKVVVFSFIKLFKMSISLLLLSFIS